MSVQLHIIDGGASASLLFEPPFGPRIGLRGDADLLGRIEDAIQNGDPAVLGYDVSGRGWRVGDVLPDHLPWVYARLRQEFPEARIRIDGEPEPAPRVEDRRY